jgi:hypothetical protein
MGWYYTLTVKCTIHPDFLEFYGEHHLQEAYMYVCPRNAEEADDRSVASTESMYESQLFCEYRDAPNKSFLASVPKRYLDYLQFWLSLDIGPVFYEYDLHGNELEMKLSKKVIRHKQGSWGLKQDYEAFLHYIVVPTTTCIHSCQIESDDFGDDVWQYSDSELRGRSFRTKELIGEVTHVWDQGAIVETRIVYKKPILSHQEVDLNRFYKH